MPSAFTPLPARAFGPEQAAHLLWRAGFGGTWEEAEKLAALGLDSAVEQLLAFPPVEKTSQPVAGAMPAETDAVFNDQIEKLPEEERNKARNDREEGERTKIGELKFWWLRRMLDSAPGGKIAPLQEKLTLFWHSHFASSFAEKIERSHPMWRQNAMLRRHALAPFPQLLAQVIRDPAMLVWLDNWRSHKGQPNENFARELMELFSTGVGAYSEDDVKASARALTGWTIDRDRWEFRFDEGMHDGETKTYLGETGKWSGDDVVRIICAQPATARFIAGKLLTFFLMENPEPALVEEAAAGYRKGGYALPPFLRALFRSALFYSDTARDQIVKSPVVLAIGALKAMRVPVPAQSVLTDALRLMGQDLFFPPDVNGWVGGPAWINSNTLLLRYNFANYLLNGVSPDKFKPYVRGEAGGTTVRRREFVEQQRNETAIEWSPKAQLIARGLDRRLRGAGDFVDHYVREFLQAPAPRPLRQQLVDYLETDAAGGKRSVSLNDHNFDERIRGLVHLIMSSPEYQLS